ncbi:MAG: permease [Clostridia bacterium]|nr:permease [Clostridia bacterium]
MTTNGGFAVAFGHFLDTYVFNMKAASLFLFCGFAVLVIGYIVGNISIKGVSLGSAGVFLVALVAGHFKGQMIGYTLNGVAHEGSVLGWASKVGQIDNWVNIVQSLGLVLFVTAVGLIAGPTFFKNLKKNFKSYVLLGVIIVLSGALVTLAVRLLVPNMTSAMATGLLSGALTSTPAFAAAKEAVGPEFATEVAVGQAVAYPFGVIGVVLFVQIVPKLMKANMAEERKLLVAASTGDEAKKDTKKLWELDKFGLAAFCLTIICGLVLGCINIPLGHGSSFNLGTTGGPLIIGLIFGHFGRIGKLSLKINKELISIFQELGLVLFLAGAGVEGGAAFVETLGKYGPLVFLYGALITTLPLIIGFIMAKYVVKLSLLNNLGSITGGMTSTPALGTLIKTAGTSDVASAYAATYPFALILIVLSAQFLGGI